MTPQGSPRSNHHPKYILCRIARNPFVLFGIALLYFVHILVIRDKGNIFLSRRAQQDNVSLRASSGDTRTEVDEYIDELEGGPQWETVETPEGGHPVNNGGVKGGVEVYPLQLGRRARKANLPIIPEADKIEGVFTSWAFPDVYEAGGGHALKGLYVLFHGCHHGAMDWFNLPEERTIVEYLLEHDYAVVAPSSGDDGGCWAVGNGSGDVMAVRAMLWRFYRDWSIPPETPLFLFGVSSGGVMATAMGSQGGFQLCEKRTTYINVAGILSQVSWGTDPANFGSGCPPMAFMPMPKGEAASDSETTGRAPPVFGASAKVPPQMVSIAHLVRKQGGKPRMLLLPVGELSIYGAFFSDRVYEVTSTESKRIHAALISAHVLECNPQSVLDEDPECHLVKDPREHPLALDTLLATYEVALRDFSGEGSSGRMGSAHAREVFRELLNVAWGAHEISADFVSLWERWLWESCGDRCRNWYGGHLGAESKGRRLYEHAKS